MAAWLESIHWRLSSGFPLHYVPVSIVRCNRRLCDNEVIHLHTQAGQSRFSQETIVGVGGTGCRMAAANFRFPLSDLMH
jgi:hypothetical protein